MTKITKKKTKNKRILFNFFVENAIITQSKKRDSKKLMGKGRVNYGGKGQKKRAG